MLSGGLTEVGKYLVFCKILFGPSGSLLGKPSHISAIQDEIYTFIYLFIEEYSLKINIFICHQNTTQRKIFLYYNEDHQSKILVSRVGFPSEAN